MGWMAVGDGGYGGTYMAPLVHCTSSAMSRAACIMNWFRREVSGGNLERPSPPDLEVPNSYSKSGWSLVPIMTK